MRRMFITVSLLALLIPVALGDGEVRAQEQTTETRSVRSFQEIEIDGPGRLVITIGETPSLTITANPDDLRRIDSEVDGRTLELEFEGGFLRNRNATGDILYEVTVPSLRGLEAHGSAIVEATGLVTTGFDLDVSGSSTVTLDNFSGSSIEVDISGRSGVTLTGAVDTQDVDVSTGSSYNALGMESRFAGVEASGNSFAQVRVTERLDAEVSSNATIEFMGENLRIDQEVSVSGNLRELPFEPLPAGPVATPTA